MTECYLLSLQEASRLPEDFCEARFPQRFARAKQYLHRDDQLRCLGAGALLCGLLSLAESDIFYGPYGKPFADCCRFSLSHSGDLILLAVSDGEVGADLEQHNDARLHLAGRVFTAEEQQWMQDAPSERFFALWTMKESLGKYLGCGLTDEILACSALPLVTEGRMLCRGTMLTGAVFPLPGHTVSVCTDDPSVSSRLQPVSAADLLARWQHP